VPAFLGRRTGGLRGKSGFDNIRRSMMRRPTPVYQSKFNRSLSIFALGLSFLGMASHAFAQDGKLSGEKQTKLEAAISKFMAASSLTGLSAAVVENGEYAWSAGFGMADLENSVPATSQTLYRLASVSKPMTAIGAMQLWEQGKLDLDAPVQKYCPEFPKKEAPITTREALGHLSGIRHYRSDSPDDLEVYNVKHFDDPIQAGLKFFENDPLIDKPGNHFHYSTQGYTLAGCVVEGASGEKYVVYMRNQVFPPAHMTETQADDRYAVIPHRTRFYQKDKSGQVVNADFLDSSYKIPGGGWLSSAGDMARFEVAILKDQLVHRATRDLMWTPLKPSDGSEDTYGLGWGVTKDLSVNAVGHSGSQQGTSTAILIAPDQQAGVVVLINMEGAAASDLAQELLRIVLGVATDQQKK
jgi:serine beta-lactamase-like protein LACTB